MQIVRSTHTQILVKTLAPHPAPHPQEDTFIYQNQRFENQIEQTVCEKRDSLLTLQVILQLLRLQLSRESIVKV